jgi:hypothetical protein
LSLEEDGVTRQNPSVSRWTFNEQQEVEAGHSQPANAANGTYKRDFEQKVAKVTKGIRVELGGGWRRPAKSSGMTKAAAATSANPVPQSPSFPLLPSVQNLFGCFCGRGAWLLAWRFDKPSVGHDKSRCCHECESSAAVPFVPFATFCSNSLRLLLWARRLAFGVAIR